MTPKTKDKEKRERLLMKELTELFVRNNVYGKYNCPVKRGFLSSFYITKVRKKCKECGREL